MDEKALVPISALQHYAYCPRQCALIHVEQAWDENIYTLRGRRAHENVDRPQGMNRNDVRIEYALPLWSETLGLVGRADAVEFEPGGTPYPVEHKVGKRRAQHADEVQLCAQALCLEEMLGRPVPKGALYYARSRRRRAVVFTDTLRAAVADLTKKTRILLQTQCLPPPVADARCPPCSLIETCMPYLVEALRVDRSPSSRRP